MTYYVRGIVEIDDTVRKVLTEGLPEGHAILEALKRDDNAALTVDFASVEDDTVGGGELEEFGYIDAETTKRMRKHIAELLVSDHEDVAEEAKEFSELLDELEALFPVFEMGFDAHYEE